MSAKIYDLTAERFKRRACDEVKQGRYAYKIVTPMPDFKFTAMVADLPPQMTEEQLCSLLEDIGAALSKPGDDK